MAKSSGSKKKPVLDRSLHRIMSRPPITIGPEVSLADAAELMLDRKVGSLLVVDSAGRLIGIITDSDFAAKSAGIPFSTLRRPQVLGQWLGAEGVDRIYREACRRTVAEVMTSHVHTVAADERVEKALRLMMDQDIKHVPVLDDGKPLGMIARHDLLKMMLETLPGASEGKPEGEG
ncbi:MAG: CBS domain-containing protein [Gemmatimonadota bacterium]